MKKLLLSVLLLVTLAACGAKPDKVVGDFIDSVKEKKFDEAFNKYAVNKVSESNLKLEYKSKIQQLLFETLFQNIEYKVVETKKQDNEISIVTVEVENIDVEQVFKKVFEKVVQHAFTKGNNQISVEDEFKSVLESKDIPKSKHTTEFIVVKTGEGNKIEVTPENIDALLGKINTTFANLYNLGGDDQPLQGIELPKSSSSAEGQKPEEADTDKK